MHRGTMLERPKSPMASHIVNHFQKAIQMEPITFTQDDAASLQYPYCDTLG